MTATIFKRACAVVGLVATTGTAWAQQQSLQTSIDRVKKLYESAAYDEALGQLDQIQTQDPAPAQAGQPDQAFKAVQEYRALCLLALDRTAEAEQTIERIVAADPEYQPDPNETAPRLVSIFYRARNRVVPVLARKQYENARALYDRRQYPEAVAAFTGLIARLDDKMLDSSTAAATSELRVLAGGFLDLSRAALLTARVVPVSIVQVPEVAAAVADKIYTEDDRDVVPPVIVAQDLPKWPHQPVGVERKFDGQIDVVVNERGDVESVILAKSIQPGYNDLAVAAAKKWKYAPATRNGVPVKFKKSVGVLLFTG